MNGIVVTHHLLYILISVALTVWVGRTLHKNGRIFIVDSFHGNELMADSVNHLLIVGFYLINFGIVSLFLKLGSAPGDAVEFIELMSVKIGIVLLILGMMHFFNMFNIGRMRRKALKKDTPDDSANPPHSVSNLLQTPEQTSGSGV